jgi:hypothetical protein
VTQLSFRARDRWGTVAAVYGLRFVLALAFAAPVVSVVEGVGLSGFADGDAILFEPSGLYLVELLRLAGPDLKALAGNALYLALPALALSIWSRAALMTALAEPGRLALGVVFERSLRALPGFLFISGLGLLARLAFVLVAIEVAGPVLTLAELGFDEKKADLTALAAVLVCLLPLLAIPPLSDLLRARVVLEGARVRDAIAPGWQLFRAKFPRVFLAWLLPALGALALGLAVAALVPLFDVSQPGGFRVLGVFLLHQLAAFGLVWFDAVWLARALSFSRPSPAGRPARSDAPRDPSSDPVASPGA